MTKTYAQRGPLQQYRVATATSFACFRCGRTKTSMLPTVFRGDWGHLLCNGCHERLLSLHDVRRGTADASEVTDALADELLALYSKEETRRAEELLRVREARSALLEPKSLRLLATAEYVAAHLSNATELDWSAAVIGLCKAMEIEAIGRVVDALIAAVAGTDLAADIADRDLGRFARYCAGRSAKPPELLSHSALLVTAAHSQERRPRALCCLRSRGSFDAGLSVIGSWTAPVRPRPLQGHDDVPEPRRLTPRNSPKRIIGGAPASFWAAPASCGAWSRRRPRAESLQESRSDSYPRASA